VPRRRNRRLTEADKVEIAGLYQAGSAVSALATQFGVNRTTICRALDVAVLARPPQRMTSDQIAEAIGLYRQGLSLDAVAGVLGRSAQTVTKELRAAGVAIRDNRGRPRA